MIQFISESHLASHARDLLTSRGWTVYPEIRGIDLVGVSPLNQIYAIECKMDFNTAVLKQCWGRLPHVDAAVALIPGTRHYRLRQSSFECTLAKELGLGVWSADTSLTELLIPRVRPRQTDEVSSVLVPQARNHTQPGLPSCRRWGKWDVLQERYVSYLLGVAGGSDIGYNLRLAIIAVEPELGGKRTPLLQKNLESRERLIACRRWAKLELVNSSPQRVRLLAC